MKCSPFHWTVTKSEESDSSCTSTSVISAVTVSQPSDLSFEELLARTPHTSCFPGVAMESFSSSSHTEQMFLMSNPRTKEWGQQVKGVFYGLERICKENTVISTGKYIWENIGKIPVSPDRTDRTPTRSGEVRFVLNVTSVLYIIPLITQLLANKKENLTQGVFWQFICYRS